eukprot:4034897-Pyramimonas_sp.AAC.1
MSPALVNASIKRPEIKNKLNSNDFFSFACRMYRSRNLPYQVLSYTVPPEERWKIKLAQPGSQLESIYLFSPEAQHRDASRPSRALEKWSGATTSILQPALAFECASPCYKLMLNYVKTKLSIPG